MKKTDLTSWIKLSEADEPEKIELRQIEKFDELIEEFYSKPNWCEKLVIKENTRYIFKKIKHERNYMLIEETSSKMKVLWKAKRNWFYFLTKRW